MTKKAVLSQSRIPENQDQKKINVLNLATQSTGFYTSQKPKLLSAFDETANLVRDFVELVYGVELAATLHQEALREYEKLIPDIPHLKGSLTGQLNSFLMITAQEVAVWKAMKKHGLTPAEAWEICHEALTRRIVNRQRKWHSIRA